MAAMGAFSQLAAQEQDASAGDQATPTVASEWEAAVDDDGNIVPWPPVATAEAEAWALKTPPRGARGARSARRSAMKMMPCV